MANFDNLPNEVQSIIWKYAIKYSPRHPVDMVRLGCTTRKRGRPFHRTYDKSDHTEAMPSLLHICSRSREMALNSWSVFVAWEGNRGVLQWNSWDWLDEVAMGEMDSIRIWRGL
jgi:hypothetical protein